MQSERVEEEEGYDEVELENDVLLSQEEEDWQDEKRLQKLMNIRSIISIWFGETGISEEEISNLIDECFEVCSLVVGEQAAIEWSKDASGNPFKLTRSVCKKDEEDLEALGGNLLELVRQRQREIAPHRFSVQRVEECIPKEYAEKSRLLDIAAGVELCIRADFEGSCVPREPLRRSYLNVAPAVNKVLCKAHDEGLNIILPSEKIHGRSEVNYVAQHFAENYPKPEGRAITDSSMGRGMKPEQAINSEEGKIVMKERWGELKHPTIQDLAEMILRSVHKYGWDKVVLWKADLKNAYGQLFVRAQDATLLTTELTDELSIIHIIMTYGFTGTGYAFGPISRAIETVPQRLMEGEMKVYVDDILAVCEAGQEESEKEICYKFCRQLLGPKAFAGVGERDKYKSGRALEMIGWEFDLDKRVVSLARKNFMKTLFEFFKVDVETPVTKNTIERLAAFASRYSTVARQMRAFVHHLHVCKTLFRTAKKNERRLISDEAKLDIFMWRAFLVLMALRKEDYCRKIESFMGKCWTALLKYDSSLGGLGLMLYRVRYGGLEIVKIASIVTPYKLRGESRFQNTMEFASVAVSFLIMAEMGWQNIPLKIIGDSKASETWCAKERFRSTVARGAAMAYLALGVEFELWIEETEFVPGEQNVLCDALSRRGENEGVSAADLLIKLGLDADLLWDECESSAGREMIDLCDPTRRMSTDAEFMAFGDRLRVLITSIEGSMRL